MAATLLAPKDAQPTTYAPEKSTASPGFGLLSPLQNAYSRLARWRADLGLPQPGSVENLQKEVKGICLIYSLVFIHSLLTQLPISLIIYLTEPVPILRRACQ